MEDADVQCGREGRHDERKYNKLLFRKRERGRQLTPWELNTIEESYRITDWQGLSTSQAFWTGHLTVVGKGQHILFFFWGNDVLWALNGLTWHYLQVWNNGEAKGRRTDTHHLTKDDGYESLTGSTGPAGHSPYRDLTTFASSVFNINELMIILCHFPVGYFWFGPESSWILFWLLGNNPVQSQAKCLTLLLI